ncbi:MAG TPA: RluA family pseudouridine synthase [Cytophagaceae bacterium]|jgi:23S rRNA pseudouridine955/2504/2580 synthase
MKKVNFKDIIVFEDKDFMLVNKPPHVSSLDDRNDPVNINKLAKEYNADAQVCHRLDKETSGILAIAKNPEAYRHLNIQFEKREVVKVYHAVSAGVHNFKDDIVDLPILALKNGIVKIDSKEGKDAATIFNTLKAYNKYTLIECRPVTGRMHQIRIHLAMLKAPIICDNKYGGVEIYLSQLKKKYNLKMETEEKPLIQRVALHARSLLFHSLDGQEMIVEAPYPKDFEVLVKQLEKYG